MIKEISLNVKEAVKLQTISIMQGDGGDITLRCNILNGDDKFIINTSLFDTVTLEGLTSKKHTIAIEADTVSENVVTFPLTKNETEEAGDMKLCVRFSHTTEERTLSTYPFIAKITENPSYAATEQKENLSAITDYINEAKKYASEVKDAVIDVRKVEDLTNTAIEKAGEAENSKTAAALSEENAASAKEQAENCANSAQESALKSESSAKKAEELAASSENYAKSAESYAHGGTNTREGEDSDNAKKYAEDAKASAEDAETDASIALQKAVEASESAASASADALTAQEKAIEAGECKTNSEEFSKAAEAKAVEASEQAELATTQASKAESSAKSAGEYADNASFDAKLAQSYAVGGSGTRDGEDSDNSKYYSEIARQHEEKTQELVDNQADILSQIDKKLGMVEFSVDDDGNLIYTDDSGYIFGVNDDGNLTWEVA